MPDILSTAVSGLVAFQRGLATTSHNIANAATDGYTRQRIELSAREPQGFGSGFIGRGVDVTTVRRLLDQFSINQLRVANSELGRLGVYADLSSRVDALLSDPDNGMGVSVQRFFAAVQDVATNPSSVTARQVMLSQAQILADQFRSISQRMDQLEADANVRIRAQVSEINTLSAGIARLNADIQAQSSGLGQPPNDLLDQRDRLLNRLSELVNVVTVTDDAGAINVFVGTGQTLVLRDQASTLAVAPSALDGRRVEIAYQSGTVIQQVTNSITGGELGGLLQFRGEILDASRQQLGLAATALAQAVNEQQAAGFNLYGQFGAGVFAVAAPPVIGDIANAGTATPGAVVADFRALTGDDYVLRFDGANWTATRNSTGALVPLTGTGAVGDPLLFEGLAVTIGAGAVAGDRFSLRPTSNAASTIRAVMTDPRGIAAAAPVRSLALDANLGNASISAGRVVDVTDPGLLNTVNLQFLSPTTYSVNGAGVFAYTPGSDITINGWSVQIAGTPATGDTFRIERNASGTGDNRNALLMAGLQTAGLLGGGNVSLGETVNGLIGRVGALAAQAGVSVAAQQTIKSNAQNAVLVQGGVNLDEEAADLLKWQRAYQAAAQAIGVADSLFQTLLAATQR